MIRRPPRSTLFPYPTLSRPLQLTSLYQPRPGVEPFAALPGGDLPPGASVTYLTGDAALAGTLTLTRDRKSTRLNSSHANISYAVFCLKKKKTDLNTSTGNNT